MRGGSTSGRVTPLIQGAVSRRYLTPAPSIRGLAAGSGDRGPALAQVPAGSKKRAGLGCRTDANVRFAATSHDDLLTAGGAIQDRRIATKGA